MCLRVMKDKIDADEYHSVEPFVADMELIRHNAHTYNHPGIPQMADTLFSAFMTELEAVSGRGIQCGETLQAQGGEG